MHAHQCMRRYRLVLDKMPEARSEVGTGHFTELREENRVTGT
jgi:hypothetical protein